MKNRMVTAFACTVSHSNSFNGIRQRNNFSYRDICNLLCIAESYNKANKISCLINITQQVVKLDESNHSK